MQYALLSHPGVRNLGDAIQSLAARHFLPRVDVRISRERLSEPPAADRIRLIANGWFMHEPAHWPPHPAIDLLPISMHFAEHHFSRLRHWRRRPLDRLLSGAGAEYLRAVGPVGARDLFTAEELSKRDIPNYLSGCLTLTLPRPADAVREDAIVASDLAPAQLAHLRRLTNRPVVAVSHAIAATTSPTAQEEAATAMLERYARAAAVVTTRVHAALPCLAFDTPVLLLVGPRAGRRVTDVATLTRWCTTDDFAAGRSGFDFAAPSPNPDDFLAFVPRLTDTCRAFVERAA